MGRASYQRDLARPCDETEWCTELIGYREDALDRSCTRLGMVQDGKARNKGECGSEQDF
jgi:hypothetical protein